MRSVYVILALGWLLLLIYLMRIALTVEKLDAKTIKHLTYASLLILAATLFAISLEHLVHVG